MTEQPTQTVTYVIGKYPNGIGWIYIGWAPEVPGAIAQGKTLDEVMENLKEAVTLILETRG
jgi:predicted RNase H-like HicB family nuclease